MRAQKNIRLLDAYTLCVNASFVIPVILPFYRDQMHIGFNEFLIAEAAFAATVVLLEVPTGWLSDVWQRKHVLALGVLAEMTGYACLLAGEGLLWAVIAQSIIGVGISLISGTNSALLYDTLLADGQDARFRKLEGRRQGLGLYSVAAASIIGGLVYPLDHRLPVALSLLMQLTAFAIVLCMTEPARHKKRPEKHPLADMAETMRYALHGHAGIALIILFAAVLFSGTKLIMWSQQPYYMALGVPETYFGLLMAAGFIMGGFSSHIGHRLDGKIGSLKALAAIWGAAVSVAVLSALYIGWSGIVLLMLGGTCLYGIASPRVGEAINRQVGSERRATILSTQNLMVSLLFIPISLLTGRISDDYGVQGALLIIALWLAVAGACLALLLLKKERRRRVMML